MGTLNEKLDYLKETKRQIKEAIISKGQSVSENDTFRSYADKIEAIEGDVNNQDKTANPSLQEQTIEPDQGYTGLSSVVISPVTSSIDPDITAQNIVEGVDILGVQGTAEITSIDITANRLVAISTNNGSSDCFAYSDDDGATWTNVELPTSGNWSCITFGNGKFVALEEANESTLVVYSTDGENWSESAIPESDWKDICYGDGKFVAVSSDRIAYSSNGTSWTDLILSDYVWNKICYGNNTFVVIGEKYYGVSSDAINWTTGEIATMNPTPDDWRIVYGDSKFVAIGVESTEGYYSANGSTWTKITLPSQYLHNLAYGNGIFLTTELGDLLAGYPTFISQDGISWSRTSNTTQYLSDQDDDEFRLTSVSYDGSYFVGLVYHGEYSFKAGLDGEWTTTELNPSLNSEDWVGMCYGEVVTGTTTIDAMLNEINGENITDYEAFDDAIDAINGESA